MNLYQSILNPYHDKKIEYLDNYYDLLEAKTSSTKIKDCEQDLAVERKECKSNFLCN